MGKGTFHLQCRFNGPFRCKFAILRKSITFLFKTVESKALESSSIIVYILASSEGKGAKNETITSATIENQRAMKIDLSMQKRIGNN